MDAYETLVLIGKILLGIYLVVIPWTFGPWIWVPGWTALMALGSTLGILFNGPSGEDVAAKNHWAIQVFAIIGYDIYFILAVAATITLQLKWFDRQDRKQARRLRPTPVNDGEYFIVHSMDDSKPTRHDTPVRQITSTPHNST